MVQNSPDKKNLNAEQSDLLMWLIIDALYQAQLAADLDDENRLTDRDHELMETMGFESEAEYLAWRTESINSSKGLNTLVQDFDYTRVDFAGARSDSGILELIRKHEAGGNYDISWGGTEPEINGRKLTECSINEVLAWQESCGKASTAVGAYQFINKTLAGLVAQEGLSGNELFSEAMQDRLATKLLYRRGLGKLMAHEITEEQFANNLSKEWASLQNSSGKGHYDGDGLNTAHANYASVVGAIRHDFESNKSSMGVDEQVDLEIKSPSLPFDINSIG